MTRPEGEQLLAIAPDGHCRLVPNTYSGIKDGLDGATLDFLTNGEVGLYLDDNGMLENQPFNVVASLMVGRCLYGHVVLTGPHPDDFGDTIPPPRDAALAAIGLAEQWQHVWASAAAVGQDLRIFANPATIPPPTFTTFDTPEDFEAWLEGRQ